MDNKEQLTEATIKALQGKLTEDKVYLSDREEEAKEFFSKIDFEPLFDKIRKTVGDNTIQFKQPELKKFNYNRFDVDFESENLADRCGIMSCVYDTVVIDNFGGGISQEKDESTEGDNNLYLWLPIDFSYQYKSGGSNGTEILVAIYTEKDGWKYRGE